MKASQTIQIITAEAARALIDAAFRIAAEADTRVSVAVFDTMGHLRAFALMDGANVYGIGPSQDKAYTGAMSGLTDGLYERVKDRPGIAMSLSKTPNTVFAPGGVQIRLNGTALGGIGVGGSGPDRDKATAVEALASCGFDVPPFD